MQIQCPACETAYEVPDQIKAGRTVQCAACGVKWAPVPAPIMPVPVPGAMAPAPAMAAQKAGSVASPLPEARLLTGAEPNPPRLRTLPAWARRSWALPAAWAASVALIIGLAALAIIQRGPMMQAWPPSTRLFAALGLN